MLLWYKRRQRSATKGKVNKKQLIKILTEVRGLSALILHSFSKYLHSVSISFVEAGTSMYSNTTAEYVTSVSSRFSIINIC